MDVDNELFSKSQTAERKSAWREKKGQIVVEVEAQVEVGR